MGLSSPADLSAVPHAELEALVLKLLVELKRLEAAPYVPKAINIAPAVKFDLRALQDRLAHAHASDTAAGAGTS